MSVMTDEELDAFLTSLSDPGTVARAAYITCFGPHAGYDRQSFLKNVGRDPHRFFAECNRLVEAYKKVVEIECRGRA